MFLIRFRHRVHQHRKDFRCLGVYSWYKESWLTKNASLHDDVGTACPIRTKIENYIPLKFLSD